MAGADEEKFKKNPMGAGRTSLVRPRLRIVRTKIQSNSESIKALSRNVEGDIGVPKRFL